eukprot:489094_1
MLALVWFIVFIEAVISSSDDSSSGDSSSDGEYRSAILDGEYRSAQQAEVGFSICAANDGNIYVTAGPITGDPITSYIMTYGRSTGVTEISAAVFQAKFEIFQFKENEAGVDKLEGVFTKNTNTGNSTLGFTGVSGSTITLTQQPGKPEKCLIPKGNWNDANEKTPFMIAYEIDEDLWITDIQRFENTVENGGVCYGYYDSDNKQFVTGGHMANNVQIMWGGELRISVGNDEVSAVCASGTVFHVLTDEDLEEVRVSWKCATSSAGATYLLSTNAVILDEIEEKECPLFSGGSSANKMYGQNVLGNDENVVNETIVINFSNATIGSLWAILIVFALVTVRMCWFWKKK